LANLRLVRSRISFTIPVRGHPQYFHIESQNLALSHASTKAAFSDYPFSCVPVLIFRFGTAASSARRSACDN
jgi:hypothetical protein